MSQPTFVSHPNWSQVTIAFALIALNSVISLVLQLNVGISLAISALRCMVQLIAVTFVLRYVFAVESMWAIALLLNALNAYEIAIKAKRRCRCMFAVVFTTMLVSNIPVSILGARFAMDIDPFRNPERYLPVMSMLCENAISGILLSLDHVLTELDKAQRTEVSGTYPGGRHSLAVEALSLGLGPTIGRMSLMGVTVIPSMMIRTILGGTDVEQAARLQIIITFMMAASTTLSCIIATHLVLRICVDSERRIQRNCIDNRPHFAHRAFNYVVQVIIKIVVFIRKLAMSCVELVKDFVQWIRNKLEQLIQNECIDDCPHVVHRAFKSVNQAIFDIVEYIPNIFPWRGARIDNTRSQSDPLAVLIETGGENDGLV